MYRLSAARREGVFTADSRPTNEKEMTMFRTALTETLGIEYPIIQAGMNDVARAELAAAVSNAGGLGVIGGAMFAPAALREQIRKVKDMTDKPFGVDLLMAAGMPGLEEQMEVVLDEGVPVFASGLGNPAPYVSEMHRRGMKVMAVVGNVRNARRCAEGGTDIIIAQGHEGGGHTGRIATLALVPQVVDAVKPLPVVAAGGIGDGRGLVAVLALGACGVWVGTRFVATHEAFGHLNYKNKILESSEEDTVVTKAFTGKTCRVIRNKYADDWQGREDELKPFPFQLMVDGYKIEAAIGRGDTEIGFMPAGQISGLIHGLDSAGDVVRAFIAEANEVLAQMAQAYLGVKAG
jgi:enoyl-[acyl-carrier protein] reductase II